MTYRDFLLVFLLPALAVVTAAFAVTARRARPGATVTVRAGGWRPYAATLAALCALAVVWTVPWDHRIIARGVWSYPEADLVGTVWLVPVEEFAFMAGQCLLLGLWTLTVAMAARPPRAPGAGRGNAATAGLLLALTAAGVVLVLADPRGDYLGSLLAWYMPPLALQCLFGGDLLRSWGRVWWAALLPPVLFLCAADRVAIGHRTWEISAGRTLGPQVAGLPLEEILFFLVTSALAVNTVLLVAHPRAWDRLRSITRR